MFSGSALPLTLMLPLLVDYALGKDCIMHGYMLKLGNPFLTQWQRRYFYLFPNRLEWRGEGESRVSGVQSAEQQLPGCEGRGGASGEDGDVKLDLECPDSSFPPWKWSFLPGRGNFLQRLCS